MIKFSDF